MAQIIKHRRGSLESVSSATKRAGELLVVTGSAGISAANGNTILFVGIDGSTVTPANKILQGTTTPDLTGATYDTSIDGIPYYNTSQEKLFIVNKGGNVEVKATAQTGGTGIVSGSSQISLASVTGNSTTNVTEGTNLYYTDARVKTKLNADGVISGSAGIIPLLPTGTVSGSSQVNADSITNFDTNVKDKVQGYGRGFRCSRGENSAGVKIFTKDDNAGSFGGQWLHLELSPEMAKDAAKFEAAWRSLPKPGA